MLLAAAFTVSVWLSKSYGAIKYRVRTGGDRGHARIARGDDNVVCVSPRETAIERCIGGSALSPMVIVPVPKTLALVVPRSVPALIVVPEE